MPTVYSNVMNMTVRTMITFAIVITMVSVSAVSGQVQNYSIGPDDDGTFITDMLSVDTTAYLVDPDYVWNRMAQSSFKGDYFNGFIQDYLWAGITFSLPGDRNEWLLEIQNPHINFITLYTRVEGSDEWVTMAETGRATVFSTRDRPHFNFVFELASGQAESIDVLFLLDKRRSSIDYPVKIWLTDTFMASQQRQYAFIGIYFGVFAIVVLITLIAWLISLRSIYFWYLCYVATLGLFVFTDIGLAHQYLYPDSAILGGNIRIFLSYILIITFNIFTISYFRTRVTFPLLHRLLLGLVLIVAGIAFLHLFFTEWMYTNVTYVLFVLYAAILTSIFIAFLTAIKYLEIELFTASLFIVAFAFVLFAGILFILSEFGILNRPNTLFTPIQIGSVLEIIFLISGLAWQVRVVEKKQLAANEKVRILENKNLRSYIDGTERERNRVAMDLHDNIGSKLGQLRRDIEQDLLKPAKLIDEIQNVVEDVRFISHKLSPQGFQITGLDETVRHLISETNRNSDIEYAFQVLDVPKVLSETVTVQLYRIIQEAIQNIEKHSKATRAEIQLIHHERELVLTIEDDGIGFKGTEGVQHGIGLKNIKKRAAILGGTASFSSQPGDGVSVIITLPC